MPPVETLPETISERHPELRPLGWLAFLLAILLVLTSILGSRIKRDDTSAPRGQLSSFPPVEIEAKAAYVYDLRTDTILFAKNETDPLPLASLTKIMSALVAEENSEPRSVVTISAEAINTDGASGLRTNERWFIKDLLDFALVRSSNDGMAAVAQAFGGEKHFVNMMNDRAAELGLVDTHFDNPTGLDIGKKSGAYGSARDMAELFAYVIRYKPELLEATRNGGETFVSLDKFAHEAENTNAIANMIPGLIASKTGLTETAGGNLVIAFDPEIGRPIIVVVLGSSEGGRFSDVSLLTGATMQYLANEK